MDIHNNLVYLENGPSGTGFTIVLANGKRHPVRGIAELNRLSLLKNTYIMTRHEDGPQVAAVAHSLVNSGFAAASLMESSLGDVSQVEGVEATTLAVWLTGKVDMHPVGKVMKFAPNADRQALATVIGTIFDPRWYPAVPERPYRNSPLEARFGLTPRWDRQESVFRRVLTAAWMALGPVTDADFFSRKYAEKLKNGTEPAAAVRFVGKYFLKCLTAAWSDAHRPRGAEPFFDPRLMFDARSLDSVRTES